MFQKECRVINNSKVGRDFFLLDILYPEEVGSILPGQFIQLKLLREEGFLFRRPFSITSVDESKNSIQVLFKVVGKTTKEMAKLADNDIVDIIAPLGNGFIVQDAKFHLLVAGGMGVAPLYLLSQKIKEKNDSYIVSFLGYKNKQEIVYEAELKKYSDELMVATDDGSYGRQSLITNLLKEYLEDKQSKFAIYTCGPKPMLKTLLDIAKNNKIFCQASLEEYMACGVGACLGCVVKLENDKGYTYQRVCKEGPVFDISKLVF